MQSQHESDSCCRSHSNTIRRLLNSRYGFPIFIFVLVLTVTVMGLWLIPRDWSLKTLLFAGLFLLPAILLGNAVDRWRKKSPHDKLFLEDISRRITQLGMKPDFYIELYHSEGADFVQDFVASIEKSAALADLWYPQLCKFEAKCREKFSLPTIEDLDANQKGQYEIYCKKIKCADPVSRGPHIVYQFSLPPIGLLAAQELWPTKLNRSVLLTPDEWEQWKTVYQHSNEDVWWFTDLWWNVSVPLDEELFQRLPSGEQLWIVTEGQRWGSLAGGEKKEVWAWNGEHTRFVDDLGGLSF